MSTPQVVVCDLTANAFSAEVALAKVPRSIVALGDSTAFCVNSQVGRAPAVLRTPSLAVVQAFFDCITIHSHGHDTLEHT